MMCGKDFFTPRCGGADVILVEGKDGMICENCVGICQSAIYTARKETHRAETQA
jgi:hypothetical protein